MLNEKNSAQETISSQLHDAPGGKAEREGCSQIAADEIFTSIGNVENVENPAPVKNSKGNEGAETKESAAENNNAANVESVENCDCIEATEGEECAEPVECANANASTNTPTTKRATNKKAITYGYARVSSRDQNLARQFAAFRKLGIPEENIVADKASGKDFCRNGYQKLRRRLKAGDTLVIVSLDRLGRDYDEVIEEWRYLTQELDANITVLDMPLLNTNISPDGLTGKFISSLVLQVLSYVAQMERENMLARQAQGIAAAKERGVQFGRPKVEIPKQLPVVMSLFEEGSLTRREAAKRLGVSVTTFDRWRQQVS